MGLYAGGTPNSFAMRPAIHTGVTNRRGHFSAQAYESRGETFKIKPLRPIEELRPEALLAKPPEETDIFGNAGPGGLLRSTRRSIWTFATPRTNNFLSTPVYKEARAFMQRPAAEALLRAHREVAETRLRIADLTMRIGPGTSRRCSGTRRRTTNTISSPIRAKGSRHNRGCAVDLTLYDLKTGQADRNGRRLRRVVRALVIPLYRRHIRQRWHRDLLRTRWKRRVSPSLERMVALRLQGLAELPASKRDVRTTGQGDDQTDGHLDSDNKRGCQTPKKIASQRKVTLGIRG